MSQNKITNLTEESQKIVDKYLECYAARSMVQYRNVVKDIVQLLDITDFRQLSYSDFNNMLVQYSENENKIKYTTSFFKFLYAYDVFSSNDEDKFMALHGSKEKCKNAFQKQKERKEKNEKNEEIDIVSDCQSPSLEFVDVEKLLEYCDRVGEATDSASFRNLRTAFTIYILFFVGKKREQLAQCEIKDYSDGFIAIAGERIEVPRKYHTLFEYALKNNKGMAFGEINNWMGRLRSELDLDIERLTPTAINKAGEDYAFRCPACGKRYLSFASNWAVINGKIVCHDCKEALLKKDVKKNIESELEVVNIELISDKEKKKIEFNTATYKQMAERIKAPCDFQEWNRYLQEIGNIGEKYVYNYEVQKLLDADREDLAEKVDASVADDHKNGYDILSYTVEGRRLHIEVKSTPGSKEEPFYISKNELEKAKRLEENGEIYAIYRVYNIGKNDISFHVFNDITDFEKEGVVYKVFIPNE